MSWSDASSTAHRGLVATVTRWLQSLVVGPEGSLFETRIITNDLLYDNIFDNLTDSPAALLRLSRTCRAAHQAVHEYFSRAYNINKHLVRFFVDVDHVLQFRSLQARTAALISGSQALQFFNRVRYDDSDLDVYVPFRHRHEVGRWLIGQGYRFRPTTTQNPVFELAADAGHRTWTGPWRYRMQGVSAVYTFTKPDPCAMDVDEDEEEARELKVQIIVAKKSPMAAILNFHSTLVLNLISWDRAYSMYPRATFTNRTAHFLRDHRSASSADVSRYSDIIRKYTNRAYKFSFHLPRHAATDPALTPLPRRLGDGNCWVLPLSQEGVTPPPSFNSLSRPLTRDPCCFSMWRLDGDYENIVVEPARPVIPVHMDMLTAAVWLARWQERAAAPRLISAKRLRVEFKDLEDTRGVLFYGYVKLEDQTITLRAGRQRRRVLRNGQVEVEFLDQYLVESCEEGLDREQTWYTWN